MNFLNRLFLSGLFLLGFSLHLCAQPVIVNQPVNQTVLWGDMATFSVKVAETGPFNYQWQLNGTNLLNNVITTVAGNGDTNFSGDGGLAINASLYYPQGVAFDAMGNLYIADNNHDRVRKVDTNGIITTVAGNGAGAITNGGSFSGDGGAATNAGLYRPNNLAFDIAGNMYIADIFNDRIRKVDTNGIITTVAGNGTEIDSGNGNQATNAGLALPASVAVNTQGEIYVADLFFAHSGTIRKVDTNGIISTIAGNYPTNNNLGDGGMATNAYLNTPQGVALDSLGTIYIADTLNARIRQINTNGIITTIAGGGNNRSATGIMATNALLGRLWSVILDHAGNLYFADTVYNLVHKVDTNGIISTVAGKLPFGGYSGDEGAATNATLSQPACVALDPAGNLFIADWYNNRIREVQLAGSPTITLSNASITNAGDYRVIITSSSGSVTSSVVTLNVQLPPITAVPVFTSSNSMCSFTWNAVSNLTYQLQSAASLADPIWVDLGNPVTATNNSASTSVTVGPDTQRFYRIRQGP
ncbi:MAG TPA: hypothetical protein VGO57_03545 [Verrucomicrobiae bacterium]|jgi:sugar lactone lactonase YvrE